MKLDPENKLSNHSTPEDTIPVTNPSLVATQPKPSHKLGPMLVALLTIILVTAGAYTISYFQSRSNPDPTQVACTLDAKICPDGSSVGRTGPNCEFAPCPSSDSTSSWQTYTNTKYNYLLKFPPSFTFIEGPLKGSPQSIFQNLDSISFDSTEFGLSVHVNPSDASGSQIRCNSDEECFTKYLSILQITPSDIETFTSTVFDVKRDGFKYTLVNDLYTTYLHYLVFLEGGNLWVISIYKQDNLPNYDLIDQILSTFTFIEKGDTLSPSPTKISTMVLNYQLPIGWQTATNQNQDFEVGFNPSTMKATSNNHSDVWIQIQRPDPTLGYMTYANVSIRPYDGGSRHNFIYLHMGSNPEAAKQDQMENYYEVEYTYNGQSCLVLYNQAFSASGTTWGMCAISPTQALFIAGPSDQNQTEEIIETINIL